MPTLEDIQEALYFAKRGQQNEEMGITYYRSGQYQKAIECFSKALEIAEEIGYRKGMGKALENMRKVYHSDCQYQKSIDCLSEALKIAQGINDRAAEGSAFGNMGNAYFSIGHYQKAIDCYSKTLEIANEIGCRKAVGTAFGNIGNVYNSIGQYQKAIDFCGKHLKIAQEISDRGEVGKAVGSMGLTYHNIGQYQKAIDCHRKCLEVAEETSDRRGKGLAFGNLGNVFVSVGQYQKAIDHHRKHLEIAEEIGDKGGVGDALGNMGIVYQKIGQYQKAIDCHRNHLEVAEEIGDKKGLGTAFGNLGNVYQSICDYQKAIDCHRNSLNMAEEVGDKQGVGESFGNIGNVYINIGQYQSAVDCHSKHLKVAEKIGDIHGIAKAQLGLGLCYQECNAGLACSFFAKSILSFQSMRDSLAQRDEYNTSMANTFAAVHKVLFENLLNLKQVKAALLVSDSGKAKSLNDLMKSHIGVVMDTAPRDKNTFNAISEDPFSKTTEALFDETLAIVIHLIEENSIISYTFDETGDLHAWVISKKGVFHKQWQTTNGLTAETYLKTVNARLHESLLPVLQRNTIFAPHVQTLQKVETDRFSNIPFIGRERRKASYFTRDLEKRVENLTRATDHREVKNHQQVAFDMKRLRGKYNLDSSIKSSVENQRDEGTCPGWYLLDTSNITHSGERTSETYHRSDASEEKDTAADNYLRKPHAIFVSPIEEYLIGSKILIVPEGSLFKVPFCALLNSENEYLCDRFNLQFTPALHVLNASLLKPLPALGPALFVGNPTVSEVIFADEVVLVPPLPNATIEANDCSKYFSAKPLLNEKASKENVVKNMKDASIIHIAAHGHMDHADIFLAPNKGVPRPPKEEHYLLTAKDVLDRTLKARLVVLSCCHSGRGQISAEGVVGIARSFLGAGARSVLVTLWKIPDKPTMEFMKLFYERVCQGLSVCVALQQAMLELKKKYRMQAWAPFQIVGEDIALTQKDIEEIRRQSCQR